MNKYANNQMSKNKNHESTKNINVIPFRTNLSMVCQQEVLSLFPGKVYAN